MIFKNILSIIFCVTTCTVFSQNQSCGWIELAKPSHQLNTQISQKKFQPNLRPQQALDADSIYTLPVVVHVIHTGGPVGSVDNPVDDSIYAMINNLNKAFRRNGPLFGGADMKIQFQLAVRSPACGTTAGINRINGSAVPNYVAGGITNYNNPGSAPETAVKRLSRWSNTDYINIWIVNKINGNSSSPGGYAYFPEYNQSTTDGIVLQASVVNGSNKTIVHEMGHYFYLYHSFADGAFENTCASNVDCTNEGDLVCDTEPHLINYGCDSTSNFCSGDPFIIADVARNYTVLNNYMSYGSCQWMFTEGQKLRARSALLTFRNGLISSGALTNPSPLFPAVACIPTATNGLSQYFGVQRVDFNTLHIYSNSSEADSSLYVDRSCNQVTTVEKATEYPISITGSYENTHRIKVLIDFNNNGLFDVSEIVFDRFQGTATGTIFIPDTAFVNTPLRMRVIADNPVLPEPAACQLHGDGDGAGQVEDYAIIVVKRKIFSVMSGNWNDPFAWSCNCVPQNDDQVTIKAGHSIAVTGAMGNLQCGKLVLQPGGVLNASGNNFKVSGRD